MEYLKYLCNGGLDPGTADPGDLRERRTIAGTALLLMPIAVILMIANTVFFGASIENVPIFAAILLVGIGLQLQATRGWSGFAANTIIASLWFAPTAILAQKGLNSSNWVWMQLIAVLAILLGGRRTGIVWTGIAMLTLWFFAGMTAAGFIENGLNPDNHPLAVAISGPLILLMLCVAGVTFRSAQFDAETRLKRNIAQLGEEVEIRRKAEQAALAADRAKATFLATVSHELRTPLNGVLGAGQLLDATDLDDEQRELVDVVANSGEVLLDLINGVLDLSKLESGEVEIELKPVAIGELLETTLAPLKLMGADKGVTVDWHVDPALPSRISADPMRLRQILLNLAGNALKFTSRGSVVVSAAADPGPPRQLVLRVSDTGIGIAPDKLDKVFLPFAQAESSTTRRFGGTGLGLAIVDHLVQALDGAIEVDSTPEAGTTFTVRLPLRITNRSVERSAADQSDGRTTPREGSPACRPMDVLLADDNEVNRMIAARMLQSLGHRVTEVEDGLQAVSAARDKVFDAVLMDVQMPNMDGLSATAAIRGLPIAHGGLPIIALTANALPADAEEIRAAGMDGLLTKPVRQTELLNALAAACPGRPSPSGNGTRGLASAGQGPGHSVR